MSKSKSKARKGTVQYIRAGLTIKRFEAFLKRAGKNEVGIATDSDSCPIARFVVEALGATQADIAPGEYNAQPSVESHGYETHHLAGLPTRKWADRFITIVDAIFDNRPVTGSQARRVLRLALDKAVDAEDLQLWQREYAWHGKGSVALARRRAERSA